MSARRCEADCEVGRAGGGGVLVKIRWDAEEFRVKKSYCYEDREKEDVNLMMG